MSNARTLASLIDGSNIVMPNGYGLDFDPNAHASGMTSEVLDDYEEGTWTPISANGGQSNNSGKYRKIGSVVFLFGKMTFDNSTGSALASVGNVPYLAAETTYVKVVMTDLSNIAVEIRPDRLNFNTETTTSFQNLTQMANKTVNFNITYIAA